MLMGLMQHQPLLVSAILRHAARHHAEGEVVSRRDDGTIDRTNYATIERRARRLARALLALGVKPGDCVGTLAMNSDRHLELYYAIMGIGAVCNTINPRLSPDDIAYIADHAEDGIILADPGFAPILEAVSPRLTATLHTVVILCPQPEMPALSLPGGITLLNYETLLAAQDEDFAWPVFDENAASGLCYTSGTTGRPKGVLFSHRSTVLHAMMMAMGDTTGLRATDRALPIVPMFHVNAWGLPFAAPMVGAALVLPGRHLDPDSVIALLDHERVTIAGGVPTVWLGVLGKMRERGGRFATLQRLMSGGAAFPRALMAEYANLGITVAHAWGMTESSPVVTWNSPKPGTLALDPEARLDEQATQGRTVFGVDVRADNEAGEVPWDGHTQGNLLFRGHWVASAYFRMPETSVGDDGWFPTGDVGVITPQGYVALTDRTKDLIKSGGEWISSIAIENIAIAHPDVAEAAAIAVPDEKWSERPLLIVVPRPGRTPSPEAIRAFYEDKVPRWSIPDRVIVAESLPHGATGKILKTELRRLYAS
jgi:fatty-acyl-CoA synthase